MSASEYKKFAVTTMIDVTKLLITLASGFFVLSTTLVRILSTGPNDPIIQFWLLGTCWLFLIFSISSGILALGSISRATDEDSEFNINDPTTLLLMKLQQVFFLLAFLFMALFSWINTRPLIPKYYDDKIYIFWTVFT